MLENISTSNERFIRSVIEIGEFRSRRHVIDAAVSLLRKRKELERAVNEGVDQLNRGESADSSAVFKRVRAKLRRRLRGQRVK